MSEMIMDAFWRAPAFARTISATVLVFSAAIHFRFLSYVWFYFTWDQIFTFPPQLWRFVSSFLLCGGGLGLILDPYFLFQYLSQLETTNPKFSRKEDLLWYLVTVSGIILLVNSLLIGNAFFLQGLVMAICYTATQDQRGMKAGFFFFTVPAQLIPVCMLGMSLLTDGSSIPLQLSGIFAAHMHDFLTRIYPEFGGGPNLLPTPALLSRCVEATNNLVQQRYGTPGQPATGGRPAGTSTGSSTGSVLPDSWRTRGAGHRLGGD